MKIAGINAVEEVNTVREYVGWERMTITADSGAADSVIPPGLVKNVRVKENEASRNGVQFCAANGTGIKIYGEQEVQ